ncbi:hypothetical protein O3G_MSEX010269 [Manduca sexta]|uniref:C2H2-type domain-containing protein n=1 Tax=Manduca sexta TaxID=7130 RepID=A0A922CS12_MANSE|nr:hypothetical protein O3G_MSEX010269 [Manduca sexta]
MHVCYTRTRARTRRRTRARCTCTPAPAAPRSSSTPPVSHVPALVPNSFDACLLHTHARSHAPPHARALHLHACACCPKVFLYPSSLSRHMMMHKGRVYGCSACQRQFRDKSSLQRHMRSAHNNLAAQAQGISYYEQAAADTQPGSLNTQPLTGDKQHSVETQPHGGDVTG